MPAKFGSGWTASRGGWAVAGLFAVAACAWVTPAAHASLARSLSQPISAYSASLFGKTSLSSQQRQTLTADPDEPLGGSTSVTFDPAVVKVTDFGFGVGYLKADNSPFETGFGIEVVQAASPSGFALIDLGEYLELPGPHTVTGYLRCWFKISGEGVGPTGKLTDSFDWQNSHQDFVHLGTNGPFGVDTHYFDFEYLGMDNSVVAAYSVFADESTNRYAFTPAGPQPYTLLPTDYVIAQDQPGVEIHPGGSVPFQAAGVEGTLPEPASTAAVVLSGIVCLARRRRHQRRARRV